MSPPVRPISTNPNDYIRFIKTLSDSSYEWIRSIRPKPQRNTLVSKGTNLSQKIDPADYCFDFSEALRVLRAFACCHSNLFLSLKINSSLDPGVVNGMRGLISYSHTFLPAPRLAVLAKDPQAPGTSFTIASCALWK